MGSCCIKAEPALLELEGAPAEQADSSAKHALPLAEAAVPEVSISLHLAEVSPPPTNAIPSVDCEAMEGKKGKRSRVQRLVSHSGNWSGLKHRLGEVEASIAPAASVTETEELYLEIQVGETMWVYKRSDQQGKMQVWEYNHTTACSAGEEPTMGEQPVGKLGPKQAEGAMDGAVVLTEHDDEALEAQMVHEEPRESCMATATGSACTTLTPSAGTSISPTVGAWTALLTASMHGIPVEPLLDTIRLQSRSSNPLGGFMLLLHKVTEENVASARSAWERHGRPSSVRQLFQAEKAAGVQLKAGRQLAEGCAALSLLWTVRMLCFWILLVEGILDGKQSGPEIGQAAYLATVEPFHGMVLRTTFRGFLRALPSRDEMLRRLAATPASESSTCRAPLGERVQMCKEELAAAASAMRQVVEQVKRTLLDLGLDDTRRV